MTKLDDLALHLNAELAESLLSINKAYGELTAECNAATLKAVLYQLRDDSAFAFDQLVDLCAVDYLRYGEYDWETESATDKGFSRAVESQESRAYVFDKPRFAVVYHLLSIPAKERVRLKARLDGSSPAIESVTSVWPSANFYEREVFDLFGVRFTGHPNLERIMMPDDWEGHPLRKDYPVEGYR